MYRIYLYESAGATVFFDASDSYDPDSTDSSNGINIYQWQVYFDKPYHEALSIDVNEYFSYDGQWAYTFSNNTLELGNDDELFIKIVLTVYDNNGKWDEHRMFFSVAPENFFDPIIELNNTLNNTEFNEYSITVNGNITYGDNYSHINVEAAFSESDFDLTVLQKYELINDGRFSVATVLQVGDGFELTLSLQEFYDANSLGERKIYVRAIDTSREIYTDVHWTNIILLPPDGDKDGIDDYSDYCPYTKIGLEVDSNGCATDRDQDGIINSMDDCPATAVNVPGDSVGCEVVDNNGGGTGNNGGTDNGGGTDNNGGSGTGDGGESTDDSAEGSTDVVMIGGVGFGVVIIILLTFLIVRKGRGGDGLAGDSYANAAFDQPMGGLAAADPSITPEQLQYEQQLLAHGYTAEQARAYADQHFRPWLNQ